jgi:2'-5' RNA ligase
MKYFIGYLVKGEAEQYHQKLVKDIASRFDVFNTVSFKAPSHITFKYISNRERIWDVERVLENLCKDTPVSDFSIGGIGSFDNNVIYLKVEPSEAMVVFRKNLLRELKKLDNIPWYPWDRKATPNFHVTIAEGDIKSKFDEVRNYLFKYNKKFDLGFDQIAILKKPKDKWILHKGFYIK